MIAIRQVSKSFVGKNGETISALEPTTLDIERGTFVSIIGPSGCGKSTLLRIIAGLEQPSSGNVEIAGVDRASRLFGFVFQEPVLLPWLTTLDNVRFPLDTSGVPKDRSEIRARDLLERMGLAGFERALPRELSGGMRQRTAIARALSYDPPILIMDEPFGALDLITRDRLNDELLNVWSSTQKTVVFVTHSVEEAAYLSDRIVVMGTRPGKIKRIYDVDLSRPRGEETKLDPAFHRLMADLRKDLH